MTLNGEMTSILRYFTEFGMTWIFCVVLLTCNVADVRSRSLIHHPTSKKNVSSHVFENSFQHAMDVHSRRYQGCRLNSKCHNHDGEYVVDYDR